MLFTPCTQFHNALHVIYIEISTHQPHKWNNQSSLSYLNGLKYPPINLPLTTSNDYSINYVQLSQFTKLHRTDGNIICEQGKHSHSLIIWSNLFMNGGPTINTIIIKNCSFGCPSSFHWFWDWRFVTAKSFWPSPCHPEMLPGIPITHFASQ